MPDEVGRDVADAPVDLDPPRDRGVEGNDICGPPTAAREARVGEFDVAVADPRLGRVSGAVCGVEVVHGLGADDVGFTKATPHPQAPFRRAVLSVVHETVSYAFI